MRRDDLGLRGFGDSWGESPEVRDTPAEVDAVFRTLRRIAATYFVVFLLLVAAFPVLTMTLDWWSEAQLVGHLSPGFLTAGVGLYVVFAVIGIAAATLSSSVESRMLGHAGVGAEHVLDEPAEASAEEAQKQQSLRREDGRILLDAAVPPESPFHDPDADADADPQGDPDDGAAGR
ncbi:MULTISPECIES: hypothetical protein [Actinomycetes]|uniref:DUF485 domain-containing protein n=2 Tax=Actinomycetes TaxID=1760 RepID=A0ABP6LUW3_9MICC